MQDTQKRRSPRSIRWITALIAGCGCFLIATSAQATFFGLDLDYDEDDGWSIVLWGSKDYSFSSSSYDWDWHWDRDHDFDLGDLESKYSHLGSSYWWSWKKWKGHREYARAIPEPSAALVFGAGLLVFGTVTRRLRRPRG